MDKKKTEELMSDEYMAYLQVTNSPTVAVGLCIADKLGELVQEIKELRTLVVDKKVVNVDSLVNVIRKKADQKVEE